MKTLAVTLALLTLAGCLAEAPAQGLLFGGVGFGYSRGRVRVSGGFVGTRLYGCGPWGPWGRWGTRFPPWCGPCFPPWWGPGRCGFTVVSVITPPPVVFPPVFPLPPPPTPPLGLFDDGFVGPPPMRVPVPAPPAPLPVVPPMQEEEKPKKPERGKEVPRPPAAKARAEDEYALQMLLGSEAFKAQEYGRAAQRFREASRLRIRETLPHFLLAQSLIAQGKYHEAHDAILAGLALDPAWPGSGFRPLELYDEALEYTDHLQMLAQVVERHPLDADLLFVHAYLLWLDGRADEASVYFRRALTGVKDRKAIELFLLALPAGETL